MDEFNWLDFCIPCKSWCCHNENPFASDFELNQLKVKKIDTKEDGSCIFLDNSGRCGVYEDRPFECRIFPFDIEEIDKKIYWTVWNVCLASSELDCEKMLNIFEKKFPKKWTLEYINEYVAYHKSNQLKKYSKNKLRIIRKIRWPTD